MMKGNKSFMAFYNLHTEHLQAVSSCEPAPHILDSTCCRPSNEKYMFCKLQTRRIVNTIITINQFIDHNNS